MIPVFLKVTATARAVRFWLVLLCAFVAWLGFGEANASDHTTMAQAQQHCQAQIPRVVTGQWDPGYGYHENPRCTYIAGGGWPWVGRYQLQCREMNFNGSVRNETGNCGCGASACAPPLDHAHPFSETGCPAGTTWNATEGKCECPSGTTMRPDGTCKSCESMNSEPGFNSPDPVVRPFKQRCLGGCVFRAKPNASTCTLVAQAPAGTVTCGGEWEFTGEACAVGGTPTLPPIQSPIPGEPGGPEKPRQECTPAGAGQTMCVKPNGDQCYTATTGKQICWKPGDTGERTEGPVNQTRNAGTEAKPPNSLTTSGGDTLTPSGDPVTTTTTINNTRTVTTTTRNYTTTSGTDAGTGSGNGEPDDGSGRPGQPDGGEEGSASGGADCDTPPISSDPVVGMVATQAWATRCAVEAGNAANVTGEVGDCKSPFSVEGTNANAEKLRALRAAICGSEGRAEAERAERVSDTGILNAAGNALEPGEGDSVFADGIEGTISTTRFGGGGGTCPASGWSLGPIGEIDTTVLCNVLAALRLLFLAIATIWAFRIIGGE